MIAALGALNSASVARSLDNRRNESWYGSTSRGMRLMQAVLAADQRSPAMFDYADLRPPLAKPYDSSKSRGARHPL